MITIQIQGSSSAGNNYVISDGDTSIMLEAGLSPNKLAKKGVKLSKVIALLITHEHGDHTKHVQDLLLSGSFDVWASQGTLDAIGLGRRCHVLKDGQQQRIGDWLILPFNTVHDDPKVPAKEPLGFFIKSPSGERIVFATDTNRIDANFKGVTHWLVECNHDVDLVLNSNYPKFLQRRIISTHMSIDSLKEYFRRVDLSTTKQIYLLHLSESNSDPTRFKREIEELTNKAVTIA